MAVVLANSAPMRWQQRFHTPHLLWLGLAEGASDLGFVEIKAMALWAYNRKC